MKVLHVSCCWRIDQCFCVLCFPFHMLDTFWLLTYSWSGSVFCELMSDKNLQSCDFLQRLHKHEIRLEHVFSKSRWTVDVQSDKIGRAYKNKGRLHIPQFHKSGFTLRRASSVDTYCTEWDQTWSFTDILLQRSCEPFLWRVNNSWERIQGAGFDILCVFWQVQSIHENYSAPSLPQNGEIAEGKLPGAGSSQNTNFPRNGLTEKLVS